MDRAGEIDQPGQSVPYIGASFAVLMRNAGRKNVSLAIHAASGDHLLSVNYMYVLHPDVDRHQHLPKGRIV